MLSYEFSRLITQLVSENFRKESREYENNIIAINGGMASSLSGLVQNGRYIDTKIQLKHDSINNWLSSNVPLLEGEPAISYEFDRYDGTKKTYRLKIGKKDPDGKLYNWNELQYINVDVSDVIGLEFQLSASNSIYYCLSTVNDVNLYLMHSVTQVEPRSWIYTGYSFSVSALRDNIDKILSDYTTSANVSTIIQDYGYPTSANVSTIIQDYDLTSYYKKSELSTMVLSGIYDDGDPFSFNILYKL